MSGVEQLYQATPTSQHRALASKVKDFVFKMLTLKSYMTVGGVIPRVFPCGGRGRSSDSHQVQLPGSQSTGTGERPGQQTPHNKLLYHHSHKVLYRLILRARARARARARVEANSVIKGRFIAAGFIG